MFNWFYRMNKIGPTTVEMADYTYANAGENGASAITMTDCEKYGGKDVVIIVAMGEAAKIMYEAYQSLDGNKVTAWESENEQRSATP